jgi:hypothetical protein
VEQNDKTDTHDDSKLLRYVCDGRVTADTLSTECCAGIVDATRERSFAEVGASVKLIRNTDILQHGPVTCGPPAATFVNCVFIHSVVCLTKGP